MRRLTPEQYAMKLESVRKLLTEGVKGTSIRERLNLTEAVYRKMVTKTGLAEKGWGIQKTYRTIQGKGKRGPRP